MDLSQAAAEGVAGGWGIKILCTYIPKEWRRASRATLKFNHVFIAGKCDKMKWEWTMEKDASGNREVSKVCVRWLPLRLFFFHSHNPII